MPPGSRALGFASRWFDPAIVHRTFEPLVADWQREWLDAPPSRRWFIRLRGFGGLAVAMLVSSPAIIRTPVPPSVAMRVGARITIVVTAVSALIVVPALISPSSPEARGMSVFLLLPSAIALAFPFSMMSAVDAIRKHERSSQIERAAIIKLAALALGFMIAFGGWVVPAANQAWRETTLQQDLVNRGAPTKLARSKPARGLRELTTYELLASAELTTAKEPGTYAFSRARSVWIEINNRATLAVLPVFLLWRRWRTLDLPRGQWLSPRHSVPATIVAIVAFVSLRGFFNSIEHAWSLPAGSGAWVELACLAMIGMIRVWLVERSCEGC